MDGARSALGDGVEFLGGGEGVGLTMPSNGCQTPCTGKGGVRELGGGEWPMKAFRSRCPRRTRGSTSVPQGAPIPPRLRPGRGGDKLRPQLEVHHPHAAADGRDRRGGQGWVPK